MNEDEKNLRPVFLAAGGTGGHLFPAQALAEELKRRGQRVILLTDARGKKYDGRFPAEEVFDIPSATLSPRRPFAALSGLFTLLKGYLRSRALIHKYHPTIIVGFGGYPSLPPLVAGWKAKTPVCLHEQNAVLGRANRFSARWCAALATSFDRVEKLPTQVQGKVHFVGNPVRDNVLKLEKKAFKMPGPKAQFRLLVFGGSQGARVFTDVVPKALKGLPKALLSKIHITQQVHKKDLTRIKKFYEKLGVKADCAAFFDNMPAIISKSHLVLSRSGASTIAELSVIGRPAILVPLPGSLDQDQAKNADRFCTKGAGWVLPQKEMTPDHLAALLTQLRYSDDSLQKAAEAAALLGKPDAAPALADIVLKTAEKEEKER